MIMENARRTAVYDELKSFFEMQGGVPAEWEREISEIHPDDSFDGLDILVGHMCAEWGTQDTRSCLSAMGAKADEIDELIADNIDFYF